MMKKLIAILFILCICVSCKKEYTCKIDYKINYPDTTIVRSHSYKCNSSGRYYLTSDGFILYVYSTGNSLSQYELDAVSKEGKIEVIRFRMFKEENKEVGE